MFTKVDFQVDNKIFVKAITTSLSHPCSNADLIQVIPQWTVVTRHVFKKGYKIAEYMTNKTSMKQEKFVIHSNPFKMLEIYGYMIYNGYKCTSMINI